MGYGFVGLCGFVWEGVFYMGSLAAQYAGAIAIALRGNTLALLPCGAICYRYCLAAQYAGAIAPYAFFNCFNLQFLTIRSGQYAGAIALRRNTLALLRPMGLWGGVVSGCVRIRP
ncbi:MAG: hypothetical protein PHW13_10200 [Methylococcales bacterium]|nr:hypothetical protein [Methylococcales bacterium]